MRVISQDGTIDVPYDSTWVSVYEKCINGRTYVRMYLCGYDDSVAVADYSTKEKAIKAIEMLRTAYTGQFITNAELSEDFEKEMEKLMKGSFAVVRVRDSDGCVEFNNLNGYFRFPKDDEVKV